MSTTNQDLLDQLSHFLTVIPQKYIDALLSLHQRLEGKQIKWVVSGDLAERLRLVKVDPAYIEIVTSKEGAEQIFKAVQEFKPQPLRVELRRLPKEALVGKEKYPVFAQSYFFEFNLNGVDVKVDGDLQFKVGDWEWGEVFDFEPEYVYVTGKKVAITPMHIQYEFYMSLGWLDRAQKIEAVLKLQHRRRVRAS